MSLQLTASTSPTLEEVKSALEKNELKLARHNYAVADLAQQLSLLQPALWRHRETFAAKGYPEVEKKLVTGYRLVELMGDATADKRGIDAETKAQTALQGELRREGIRIRDAAVRLARDNDQDSRLFSVNFGEGDASNVLPPLHVLHSILKKHGEKLGNETLRAELTEAAAKAIDELHSAEVRQETAKKDALIPAGLRKKAHQALYALLLHFSRTGGAVFWNDAELQELFSLKPLRKGLLRGGRPGLDDDDAPILAVAGGAGVEVPEGPLVAAVTTSGDEDE